MQDDSNEPTDEADEVEKPKWRHDEELNFTGAKQHLNVLATALQKTIEEEKKRLSKMIGARNSFKK